MFAVNPDSARSHQRILLRSPQTDVVTAGLCAEQR